MNWNDLKIGRKLGLAFGLLLLMQAATVGIGLMQISRLGTDNDQLARRYVPSLTLIGDIGISLNELRRFELRHVLSTDAAQKARSADGLRESVQALAKLRTEYEKFLFSDEERALYERFGRELAGYEQVRARVLALSGQGDDSFLEARSVAIAEAGAAFDKAESVLGELKEINTRDVARQAARADETEAQALTVLLSVLAAAVLAGIALALAITRGITRPAQEALRAVETIATGDLSARLETRRRDEMGQIQQALDRMAASLRQVVAEARSATDSISTASSQIASGGQDLSGRTEQAASSLQQTASAMEQLTGTVRQSADSARQAQQLAVSASGSAQRGGEVVSQVVSNMEEISASSRKIADIIGVIDGIAFQTNILALNAAVEAARAGEQGRGFAVVAGEVRNLAQRSAQAAKEIKTLIQGSVEKIEGGARLVDDAGRTMHEIVGSVQRVTDIIGEISAATQEQSGGIGQVNQAVNQLDRMTQQNAALVEESAAAADSLREQAQRLAALMGGFRLDAGGARPATPAQPAAALAGAAIDRARATAVPARTAAAPPKAAPAPSPTAKPLPAAAPAPAPAAPAGARDDGDWETF